MDKSASIAEAVERLARAAGMHPAESGRAGWHAALHIGGNWHIWHSAGQRAGTGFHVGGPTALLALLCLSRRETLTSEPMPNEADARAWAEARALSGSVEIVRPSGQGPARLLAPEYVARVERPVAVRVAEVGRLVLDAAPKPHERLAKPAKYGRAKCSGCGHHIATTRAGLIRSHTGPGPGPRCSGSKLPPDTQARDALAVWADSTEATGDPLGRLLSEWLAWDRLDAAARDRWAEDARTAAARAERVLTA